MSTRVPLPGVKGPASVTLASLPKLKQCQVMVITPGGGSAILVVIGQDQWVRDNQAYARIAGAQTAEALFAQAGKWVRPPNGDATVYNLHLRLRHGPAPAGSGRLYGPA